MLPFVIETTRMSYANKKSIFPKWHGFPKIT